MNDRKIARLLKALGADAFAEASQVVANAPSSRTPACISLPRFRTALLRRDWTPDERVHVNRCSHCQKTERQFRQDLWHPSLGQLIGYAAKELGDEEAEDVGYHVNTDQCARCKRMLERLQTDDELIELVEELIDRHGVGDKTHAEAFLPISAADELLEPILAGEHFAGCELEERRFQFDGGELHGVWYYEEGSHWLHVESSKYLAGTLVYLILHNEQGNRAWERYVMLRPGVERPAGRARVSSPPPGSSSLIYYLVDAAKLTTEDVEVLKASFDAAREDEKDAVPSWQTWAKSALGQPGLDSQIQKALGEIAGQC